MPHSAFTASRPRSPATHDASPYMYSSHQSPRLEHERYTFPPPPRHTTSRRVSTPDHRHKPDTPDSPSAKYSIPSPQRRASTPDTMHTSPYDYHIRTPETHRSRHADDRAFPGPLRIPAAPRFLISPSPSPHDSPASSWSTQDPFTSTRLPPIRHFDRSPRNDLPHLSSARWHEGPFALEASPAFLDMPSPTPSSPDLDDIALPIEEMDGPPPGTPRYEYPKYEYSSSRRHISRGGEPQSHRSRGLESVTHGYAEKEASRSHPARRYPSVHNDEEDRIVGTSAPRRGSISSHHSSSHSHSHRDESPVPSVHSRTKFGLRKGSRFFCTYVSPLTGERCGTWDKGWTVYATLVRHAEAEHAHEELSLLARGGLTYEDAQIVTSREKMERIEENLAQTGRCSDCGTVFSSRRKDSLSRHKATNACEKAQRRGKPPTKFPKKPKGPSFHVLEGDSDTS
ncbi:hypothetical protein K439DRAFT_392456 [Ramaria rubella]|nr:hypothetical protein K439DRAFT_392456 [Ramaria rubella]